MNEPESKEGKFLKLLFDQMGVPKHPIFAIMVQQLAKLTNLVDKNEEIRAMVRRVLNYVKENWNDETGQSSGGS